MNIVHQRIAHRLRLGILCTAFALLAARPAAFAQYSQEAFSQAQASSLYDERGYADNKAITIDGSLAVSNSNGNVSYVYPLASSTVSGVPFTVTLTYAGSVAFSAFKDYASGNVYEPYARWNRFSVNKPAWILGCMGFAVQMLSSNTMYHADPAKFAGVVADSLSDRHMIWLADGYDVCNRMEDLVNATQNQSAQGYTDVIQLLRADGSVLKLYNKQAYRGDVQAENRPELYTGHYVTNAANERGYGVVAFDSSAWQYWASQFVVTTVTPTYPFIPRVLRYYDGSGLEFVFRERTGAYGAPAYRGTGLAIPTRYGGMKAQPTIFYLEEVNSNAGPIVRQIGRSRHHNVRETITLNQGNIYDPLYSWEYDSTAGRALVTSINDVQITYGNTSLTVESAGRTAKVRIGAFAPCGNAPTNPTSMPLATRGYFTTTAKQLATLAQQTVGSSSLYHGYLGYVAEIIDAAGRSTTFSYEPYTRTYVNYGFPVPNQQGIDKKFSTRSLRLKEITEPLARTTIAYTRGDIAVWGDVVREDTVRSATIRADAPNENDPFLRTNVASVVRRYDRMGAPLTETRYEFLNSATDGFWKGYVDMRDKVTDSVTSTEYTYLVHAIADSLHIPYDPNPRFTELRTVTETAAGVTTVKTTEHANLGGSPYVWLPVATETMVAGVPVEKKTYAYTFDTARAYGGNTTLAPLFGLEVRRGVVRSLAPNTLAVRLLDTTEYIHLQPIDTPLVRLDTLLDKFTTYRNFKAALDSGAIRGFWEEWMFNPRVAVFTVDSMTERTVLPPHYGMVRRQVTADATGAILGGVELTYTSTAPNGHYLNDLYFRGTLERDTLIGEGGVRRPGTVTTYTRGVGLNAPETMTNAAGAVAKLFYGSYSSPSLRINGRYEAHARILRNDGTVKDSILPHNGAFSILYNKPMASEERVRKYDPATLALTADTLVTLAGYTFHGLTSVAVDPAGVVTAYDYDPAGRLRSMRAAGDFARTDTVDTALYRGSERLMAIGTTVHRYRIDTIDCGDGGGVTYHGPSVSTELDRLYAGHPATIVPTCPCDTAGTREKRERATVLANCNSDLPYVDSSYFEGVVSYRVDSSSALLAATTLDTAYLELHTTAVAGTCVALTVKASVNGAAPILTKTFLLNCDAAWGGGGGGNNNGTGTREKDPVKGTRQARPMSGGDTAVGYTLRVDLAAIRSTLLALNPLDELRFTVSVPTASGGVEFVGGINGEDTRPTLYLAGEFARPNDLLDYTLAFTHDELARTVTRRAKVDDRRTSNNDWPVAVGNVRRSVATHTLGGDGRVLKTATPVVAWHGTRTDSTMSFFTGTGARTMARNQNGDTIRTTYDGAGRVLTVTSPDGTTRRMAYYQGAPAAFGIVDSGSYGGFASVTVATDERGVKFATYADVYGNTRREIADSGGLHLVTLYEYDVRGRTTMAVNPKGDTTRYWYDAWGNVMAKSQPDIGMVTYAYDLLGNLRFMQNQGQAGDGLVQFSQYDDLNRLSVAGVADLGGYHNEDTMNVWLHQLRTKRRDDAPHIASAPLPGVFRWTDYLDPDHLHTGADTTILTANKTLWMNPARAVPAVLPDFSIRTNCTLPPNPLLGETESPTLPAIMRPAAFYHAVTGIAADTSDFEHVALYPEFVRTAIAYDTLPAAQGAVWGNFPTKADWDAIAPAGSVRHQRGREAAVAWRERGAEPFHYAVVSYDERGRAEAILRYTDNLGFDVVYYTWNAMNQITSITQADYLRHHTTWYGYDAQGRVDSVWTALSGVGAGLFRNFAIIRAQPMARPSVPDMVHRYDRMGRLDTLIHPPAGAMTTYGYNRRGALDSLVATLNGGALFRELLSYDPSGRVIAQRWQHGSLAEMEQRYGYDDATRLAAWTHGQSGGAADSTAYAYDPVGNRAATDVNSKPAGAYIYTGVNNQLIDHLATPVFGNDVRTRYAYTADGAMSYRERQEENAGLVVRSLGAEEMGYSYRGLTRRYVRRDDHGEPVEDWRYRYSAFGEREQKRLYAATVNGVPQSDSTALLPWVYYLLGAGRQQLAVYHGSQTSAPMCGDTGRRVYMYPVEYLSYGAGGSAPVLTSPTNVKTYVVSDHLGSARVTLSAAGVASRTDYEPFGTPLAVAGVTPRKSFIDKEKDAESGTHNMGVRQLDEARFLSVDPLWEKYRAFTPYQYGANNPIAMFDANGMAIDLSSMVIYDQTYNAGYTSTIINDLKAKTGLALSYDSTSGLLVYDPAKTDLTVGSQTLRKLLMEAIDSKTVVAGDLIQQGASQTPILGGTAFYLSVEDIEASIAGTVGADPTTYGWAMTFLHETAHTAVGPNGGLSDDKGTPYLGEVETLLNQGREELGSDYGKRLRYNAIPHFNTGYNYIPFSFDALMDLKQGIAPRGGKYIKRRSK